MEHNKRYLEINSSFKRLVAPPFAMIDVPEETKQKSTSASIFLRIDAVRDKAETAA